MKTTLRKKRTRRTPMQLVQSATSQADAIQQRTANRLAVLDSKISRWKSSTAYQLHLVLDQLPDSGKIEEELQRVKQEKKLLSLALKTKASCQPG